MRWFKKRSDYRPTTRRTQGLIALLAVVTAGAVLWAVLAPEARRAGQRAGATRPVPAKVDVFVVPAASTPAR